MIKQSKRLYILFALLAGLALACSSEPSPTNSAGGAGQAGSASPPAAASGGAAQNGAAQNGATQNGSAPAGSAAPGSTVPASAPATPGPLTVKPADSAASSNAKAASNGKAPKFVVPTMKLDFGTQKTDKTLARSIVIKNEGNAELKIESVEPS
jgi:hypothetical protein